MTPEALVKFEELLIRSCEEVIERGQEIVSGMYHPDQNSCCPIYAACDSESRRLQYPLYSTFQYIPYQKIIADYIGEPFITKDLGYFITGFDNVEESSHCKDNPIFHLGQRLRQRYITKENNQWEELRQVSFFKRIYSIWSRLIK